MLLKIFSKWSDSSSQFVFFYMLHSVLLVPSDLKLCLCCKGNCASSTPLRVLYSDGRYEARGSDSITDHRLALYQRGRCSSFRVVRSSIARNPAKSTLPLHGFVRRWARLTLPSGVQAITYSRYFVQANPYIMQSSTEVLSNDQGNLQ